MLIQQSHHRVWYVDVLLEKIATSFSFSKGRLDFYSLFNMGSNLLSLGVKKETIVDINKTYYVRMNE